jgi:hypothetical protein
LLIVPASKAEPSGRSLPSCAATRDAEQADDGTESRVEEDVDEVPTARQIADGKAHRAWWMLYSGTRQACPKLGPVVPFREVGGRDLPHARVLRLHR